MSIYIFSRQIHNGKTTALWEWCNQQKNIAGVLMPDINGRRRIVDVNTKEVFDIECADAANTTESLTSVGRFHFYSRAFERANSILNNAIAQEPRWLVIDEAGKLELDGKGFFAAIIKAILFYDDTNTAGNLIITVRESLCNEMISFFKLKNYRVIHQLEELIEEA
jgi:nucleoside-triphosphatase THEP1